MPSGFSLPIKTKLFLLRLGFGIVMALAIGTSSYFIARRGAENKLMESLVYDARQIGHRLEIFFTEEIEAMNNIANNPAFTKFAASGREPLLFSLYKQYAHLFTSLSYVNPEGDEEVRVEAGKISETLKNVSGNQSFLRALENPNTVVISDYIPAGPQAGPSDQGVVELYLNVIDFFDQQLGCIMATLSGSDFETVLGQNILNSGGIVILLDRSNKIVSGIFHDSGLRNKFYSIRHDPVFINHNLDALHQKDPSRVISFLGRKWNLASTEVTPSNYRVIIWAPNDKLYENIRNLRNQIFLISLILIIIGELFSRLLGLKITEPIEELNRLTAKIAGSGSMTERIKWQSGDELGQLAHSFNKMLDKLTQLMEELENEQQFSQGVLSSMADMLCVVSPAGTIITVNRSLTAILEYDEGELVGEPVEILFSGHKLPVKPEQLFDSAGGTITFRRELELQTKNSAVITVDFVGTPLLDHNGHIQGNIFLAKDIRSEKRLEEERQKNEARLKKVNEELFQTEKMALVGQMSGMVAHEVLNPISAINVRVALNLKDSNELNQVLEVLKKIVGDWVAANESGNFAEYFAQKGQQDLVLLGKIAEMLGRKQQERQRDLEFIERLVTRVIKTIDGFREMSRRRETIEEVSIYNVTREILEDMRDGIKKRGIHVSIDCRVDTKIRADFMEIYSIISNIIRNALQAIDQRGDQTERKIDISLAQQADGSARILISDSGIGMDDQTKKSVFEPDFSSKGRKGTGIGMSFSRKIAIKYGGNISILNTGINRGTTFEVVLKGVEEAT